jgi:hypothetical protein
LGRAAGVLWFPPALVLLVTVSPVVCRWPVGVAVAVVGSATEGVADMSRVVAGAGAPVSPSLACLDLSPHAVNARAESSSVVTVSAR